MAQNRRFILYCSLISAPAKDESYESMPFPFCRQVLRIMALLFLGSWGYWSRAICRVNRRTTPAEDQRAARHTHST